MADMNPFAKMAMNEPVESLGPFVSGMILQAFLSGVVVTQAFRYFTRNSTDNVLLHVLVMLSVALALVQTTISFYNLWDVHVLSFGDWQRAINLGWADKVQPALTCAMALLVQTFLLYRCWRITNKTWWKIAPLIALQLSSFIAGIITTTRIFAFDFGATTVEFPPEFDPSLLPPLPIDPVYSYWLISTAVLDVAITSVLLYTLLRSKSRTISVQLREVIRRLVGVVWKAALPPCVCAIIIAGIFIGTRAGTFWNVFFQAALGKLYVISLLVSLNSRSEINEDVRSMETSLPSFPLESFSRDRRRNSRLRVQVAIETNATEHDRAHIAPPDGDDLEKGSLRSPKFASTPPSPYKPSHT